MVPSVRRVGRSVLVCVGALALACGGKKSPTSPGTSVTGVTVGVSGGGAASVAPGETRQLFATAARTDGSTSDVTNLATWQTSNPALATVSPAGVLSGAAEGAIDVFATYNGVRGSLHAEIKRLVCDITIAPRSASFTPLGGSKTVTVTVSDPACHWTAQSDASWFPFTFDPGQPGSGSFRYDLPQNSTPSPRTATIVVQSQSGQRATHAIDEDNPGCSYVAQPEESVFSAAGGTGQFTAVVTPDNCSWNAVNGMKDLGVSITSVTSGTGTARIRYSVQASSRAQDVDGYIEIAGLSGKNPNGRHHIIIRKR